MKMSTWNTFLFTMDYCMFNRSIRSIWSRLLSPTTKSRRHLLPRTIRTRGSIIRGSIITPFWGGVITGIIPAIFLLFCLKFPVHTNQYVRMVTYTESNCPNHYDVSSRHTLTLISHDSRSQDTANTIYFITPTYRRATQKPDFVRLAQTLMQVPNLHWLVVQDGVLPSDWLSSTLNEFGLGFTLIACHRMTESVRKARDWKLSKGATQRNCGLKWLRDNDITTGTVYFGDDDNTYHLKLFEEIRSTKRASMFPVGNIERTGVSAPIVVDGVIVDILDPFKRRKYPIDMAGFAVNIAFLNTREAYFKSEPYFQEELFLSSLGLTLQEFEPKAKNCTEILVWHTRTEPLKYDRQKWKTYSKEGNNLNDIEQQMVFTDEK